MGQLSITFATTGIFYLLCMIDNTHHQDFIGPTVFVFIFSLLITIITLGLFREAIIASLMCLAIDMDLNNGSP
jgi:hypothetical protein